MSNETQTTATPAVTGPGLDMVTLLLAAGNPVRWQVLQVLATEGHGFFSAP